MTKPQLRLTHDKHKTQNFKFSFESPYSVLGAYLSLSSLTARKELENQRALLKKAVQHTEDGRYVLFVVGKESIYDPELAAGTLVKKGRTSTYSGGSVYATFVDAFHAIFDKPDYGIYVIECQKSDLYFELNGEICLLKTVPVVEKLEMGDRDELAKEL